jgi:DNA-directed RNA polymerase subunit beta'
VKIPRAVGKSGDITGGLPRVTELFEARNPSNPAVVSEIDGEVEFGKIKRGNREIIITSKAGEVKKYLVPLSKQILVQENDYVRAGTFPCPTEPSLRPIFWPSKDPPRSRSIL